MVDLALAAQAFVWVMVCAAFVATRQASMFHPLSGYLVFHGLVFVVRPLLVHFLGFDAMWIYTGFEPTELQFVKALEVSSLALMVFASVTLMTGWCKTQFSAPATFSRDQVTALKVITVLLVPVVAYSIKSNLLGDVRGERVGGTFIMKGVNGYTAEAQYMAGPLICAWLAVTRFKPQALWIILPYIFYRSYSGWSRWTLLLIFISIALIYGWLKRIKWPPAWAFVGALPLLMLFHALGQNREYFQQVLRGEEYRRPVEHPGAALAEKWRVKYDGPDFANFDFLTFVVSVVPERSGMYNYGSPFLAIFTEPIPRKLWPGKPIGAPVRSFDLNQYGNFIGMTPTLAGAGWMSGGWVGVTIMLGGLAAVLGRYHRWFWAHAGGSPLKVLWYLVVVAMLPQFYRDGGINVVKFIFWNVSPLILWAIATWILQGCRVPVEVYRSAPHSALRVVIPGAISRGPTSEKASFD
jgi:hypothetical protein